MNIRVLDVGFIQTETQSVCICVCEPSLASFPHFSKVQKLFQIVEPRNIRLVCGMCGVILPDSQNSELGTARGLYEGFWLTDAIGLRIICTVLTLKRHSRISWGRLKQLGVCRTITLAHAFIINRDCKITSPNHVFFCKINEVILTDQQLLRKKHLCLQCCALRHPEQLGSCSQDLSIHHITRHSFGWVHIWHSKQIKDGHADSAVPPSAIIFLFRSHRLQYHSSFRKIEMRRQRFPV